MRLVPVLLVLLLQAGCAVEKFAIRGRSCDEDLTRWSRDLTTHLLNGKRTEGSFDYDPEGAVQRRVLGGYDLHDGDFGWTTWYHPDHWRVQSEVSGYGYARSNGDLDVEYTVETEDVNGETWSVEVRTERIGCEVDTRYRSGDSVRWHSGTYGDGRYAYEDTDPNGAVVKGTSFPDGTYEESYESQVYAFEGTGDADDGTSRRDWRQSFDGGSAEGFTESFLDGGQRWHIEVSDGAVWDYSYDYDGNGSGTYKAAQLDCQLTYHAFSCTYDCGAGQTGPCS